MTEQRNTQSAEMEMPKLLSRDEIGQAILEKLQGFADAISTPELKNAALLVMKNEMNFGAFTELCGQHKGVDDPSARSFADHFILEVSIPHMQSEEEMNLAFNLARKNNVPELGKLLEQNKTSMVLSSFMHNYFLSIIDKTISIDGMKDAEQVLLVNLYFNTEMQHLTSKPYFDQLVAAQGHNPMQQVAKEVEGQDVLLVENAKGTLAVSKDGRITWVGAMMPSMSDQQ